ncbi:MAG TPA: Uma2 family endonuclease [Acetobacteraceae bacterium]|nr:Uma2 family endonuclease [Acetobacteraceae bacterium]
MAQHLTREQFRTWAIGQKGRFERVAGEPVAMAPERIAHARIKARIWAALDRAIRDEGLPCEALPDGITIEVDQDTDYEPDAVVNCGPLVSGDEVAATNPVIVVEVLSPGTQSVDLGGKFADYFKVPTIHHYLIVRTLRREVIHHSRSGSDVVSRVISIGCIVLDPPGISIDLAHIYPAGG